MRVFQNSGIYPAYQPFLKDLTKNAATFDDAVLAFLSDRYGAAHILKPVLEHDPICFFTNGNDEHTQRLWARDQGLKSDTPLDEILLAQIEHHNTEIFYNSDPMRYGDLFLKRLPGCVRRTVAWRAAPSDGGQFLTHDIIVNNFPTILEGYRARGVRAEYFAPAHDPEMNFYAAQTDRPIDVLFVGGYSRHHKNRAKMLELVAAMRNEWNIVMHLDRGRLTKLAETPLGWIGPLAKHRRSVNIRAVATDAIFGRELLTAIGNSKIVVNGAVDMAGPDRGNMRVWEALGCGAALVTDAGRYPDEMIENLHFRTYATPTDAVNCIRNMIDNPAERLKVAETGHKLIAERYSKAFQWNRFQEIVA
ncbi:glycosyltransferase family 1 protein [Sphingorhabdus sp. IMCC26285]|uniref:Glycosyltransferase family 1 protein n=1 Tax=Sphingorhabdus profundilacus TaxID=2509718 RepID=A0A6I4LZL8_9SPHN|nr:glycosyltransferase [Sphingorhabdus profundilacus]MVZ98461.1 glycosyltransferase family 1 protein [Sphingorhabdus profundilacus]